MFGLQDNTNNMEVEEKLRYNEIEIAEEKQISLLALIGVDVSQRAYVSANSSTYKAKIDELKNLNRVILNINFTPNKKMQYPLKDYPINIVSGRIVEHMGTGTETRASKYLSELSSEMYWELHPRLAGKLGLRDNEMMWVYGTGGGKIKIKCKYSLRVDEHSVFLPQNFSGIWSGEHLGHRYPAGTQPYGFCENSNQVTSYGYDQQTSCPETKCYLVRIERA